MNQITHWHVNALVLENEFLEMMTSEFDYTFSNVILHKDVDIFLQHFRKVIYCSG